MQSPIQARRPGGGTNDAAVKVPGTNEDVIVGDYFQWAAYAGYCGSASAADKGLLIYNSFTNTKCVGVTGTDEFFFKTVGSDKYYFSDKNKTSYKSIIPYHNGTSFSQYTASVGTMYLQKTDDVANIILGDNWRMPTSAEFQAMSEVTYWAWHATDRGYYVFMPGLGTSGVAGGRADITSSDDKSKALLFFPAAGDGYGSSLYDASERGHYWSSTLYSSGTYSALYLFFTSGTVRPQDNHYRHYGHSVRPVSD